MSGLAGTPQFLRIALRVVIETLHFHKAQTGLFSMTTLFHIKGALGKTWNGMDWIGMEWNGMDWNGMEWNGLEWNGFLLYHGFLKGTDCLSPISPPTLNEVLKHLHSCR